MQHFVKVTGVTYTVEIEKTGIDEYSACFQIGMRDYYLWPLYSVENAITSVEQEVREVYPELVACNAEPAPRWMRVSEPVDIALERWQNGEPLPAPVSPVKWRA